MVTWARMIALSWLTLAAATLPASARSAAPPEPRPRTRDLPADSKSAPVSDRRSEPKSIVAAPALDVWDGHATRTRVAQAPVLRPTLLHQGPGGQGDLPGRAIVFRPHRLADDLPSSGTPPQKRWLACRYSHGPPVGL